MCKLSLHETHLLVYQSLKILKSFQPILSGRVYKGILFDNQHVAIKHIVKDGCVETFLREVRSLIHVRHPNLVALLGYGTNDDECFLIYELCPNGNLAQWLFGTHSLSYRIPSFFFMLI